MGKNKQNKEIKIEDIIGEHVANVLSAIGLAAIVAILFIIIFVPSKKRREKKTPKPKSKIEKLNDEYHFISRCEDYIKSNLNYPSTYKSGFLDKDIIYPNDKMAKVIIEYRAKNAFNLEIKYKAVCSYNDKPAMIDFSNYKNF